MSARGGIAKKACKSEQLSAYIKQTTEERNAQGGLAPGNESADASKTCR